MQKHTLALVLVSAALLTSCSDNDAPVTPGAPSLIGRGGFSIGLDRDRFTPELVGNPFCPVFPPFLVPFNVTVGADEGFAVSLTEVRMRFVDTSGVQMPQVTMPAPVLTTQFGSTLVEARRTRSFPFLFRFGCDTARAGTLVVIVRTEDERGRAMSNELKATVQ
jgi:hypothetical protein